ncbi:hypothetical protein DL546_008231 [Coniochaeta pulveracea]|uniref:Helix-turn-helix domain-containing protein n=1 Tax=Coniochaeta pulveracea TaxID=177199 RepID=A0A420YKE5_9PEZI|nr:hypothetical protein DL546_008231 [Coniochaeta pulveracea]
MGASASKTSANKAIKTARQFPKRAPGAAPPRPPPSSISQPAPTPSESPSAPPNTDPFQADAALRTDQPSDTVATEFLTPTFADRLKKMGVAQPNPTFSPSSRAVHSPQQASTNSSSSPFQSPDDYSAPRPTYPSSRDNQTLSVLEARRRITERAEAELENIGKRNAEGREFVDIATIRRALLLRQGGVKEEEIEDRFGLKRGTVRRLGGGRMIQAVEGGAQ